MYPIHIPHLLRQPEATQIIHLDGAVPDLESLTPVKGQLKIRHGGTFLEVGVSAETIVNLTCDRCIQSYNYRLTLNTSELIWLEAPTAETLPPERELAWEDLSEQLPPDGDFDVDAWLYEQFTLALPLQRLCGKDCQPPSVSREDVAVTDGRWSALEILKQQLTPSPPSS